MKSYSAKQIPKVMPHIGKVWQSERFDRIVRNDRELANIWQYIRQNPVKAKLANTPETYLFSGKGQNSPPRKYYFTYSKPIPQKQTMFLTIPSKEPK